jgi:hypothetical protein
MTESFLREIFSNLLPIESRHRRLLSCKTTTVMERPSNSDVSDQGQGRNGSDNDID